MVGHNSQGNRKAVSIMVDVFYVILCKSHSTSVDSVEVLFFSGNETKLESSVFNQAEGIKT